MDLSFQKALAVSKKVSDAVILSCDSIIYIDDKKLEKPKSKDEAKEMLLNLSGRVNYADKYNDKIVTFNETTEVYFDNLTNDEIDWYINHEEYILERCGYSIAGKSMVYIPKINGDYYNILEMPISRVYKELQKIGYSLHDFDNK